MKIRYLFRKPKFPVICSIDGVVVAGNDALQLEKIFTQMKLTSPRYQIIDSNGEDWDFAVEDMILSPLNFRKRVTKLELIKLVNARENNESGTLYSEKSLSAKRYEKIFNDLVEMLS